MKGQQSDEVQIQLVLLSTTKYSPGPCCKSHCKNSYIKFSEIDRKVIYIISQSLFHYIYIELFNYPGKK